MASSANEGELKDFWTYKEKKLRPAERQTVSVLPRAANHSSTPGPFFFFWTNEAVLLSESTSYLRSEEVGVLSLSWRTVWGGPWLLEDGPAVLV